MIYYKKFRHLISFLFVFAFVFVGQFVLPNIAQAAIPANEDSVFTTSVAVQGGATITIDPTTSSSTDNFWFASVGTATSATFATSSIMTTATGTATSILAPATAGTYSLFVIDTLGNVSNPSVAVLTVDNTTPFTASNLHFSNDSGASSTDFVTNNAHPVITATIYPAPSSVSALSISTDGMSYFHPFSGMTMSGNTMTLTGYNLIASGVISFKINSTYLLGTQPFTLDMTAPVNENSIFATSVSKHGGVAVAIDPSTSTSTDSFWFAPSGTATSATFIASATMTTSSGGSTSILSPATAGTYNLYVIDLAGNVSIASTAILTVDNTAPSAPVASPTAGTYIGTQSITLSAVGSTSIYYTIDGTSPTCSSGLTNNPISITSNVTINVIACNNAGNGTTASFTYTFSHSSGHPVDNSNGGGGGGNYSAPIITTSTTNTNISTTNVINSGSSSTSTQILTGTVSTQPSDKFLAEQAALTLAANLKLGSTSLDVKILQKFLATQDMGPKAQTLAGIIAKYGTTMYFRNMTQAALIEWQQTQNITPSAGFFGPITRAKISNLYSS